MLSKKTVSIMDDAVYADDYVLALSDDVLLSATYLGDDIHVGFHSFELEWCDEVCTMVHYTTTELCELIRNHHHNGEAVEAIDEILMERVDV